ETEDARLRTVHDGAAGQDRVHTAERHISGIGQRGELLQHQRCGRGKPDCPTDEVQPPQRPVQCACRSCRLSGCGVSNRAHERSSQSSSCITACATNLPHECPTQPDWATRRVRAGTTPNGPDRKSTRLNSSHVSISYAVFCLKKKNSRMRKSHERTEQTLVQR